MLTGYAAVGAQGSSSRAEAAAVRPVDQAGAGEDEALHGGGAGGAGEVLRAEVVDRVRLLGRRAAEERGAVDHGIDAAHRGGERVRVEQIALGELDTIFAQFGGTRRIAHEGAHSIAALGKRLASRLPTFPVAPVTRILIFIKYSQLW